MLSRKMDAIKCILQTAESAASSFTNFELNETAIDDFTYYSSKFSKFNNVSSETLKENMQQYNNTYLDFTLNPDTHFYNISVDTEHSSVHVPSNIYDRDPKVMTAIMWSENLDEVFRQNYQSDPALSWQYFGSDTGILRHFPALQWEENIDGDRADTYDCRKRSWYIETATCSKDIVILLDNSGSMSGFRNHVAKFTIRSILETFSNNDFFTIYKYSNNVSDIIPCFKSALVQATKENIRVFNDAIAKLKPEGYANLTKAYTKAFELLKTYYIDRKCNETAKCNQAIMLVTDGVAGNTTEIFDKYNRGEDGMNVRIFTYLLGKEVTKVREIQWMACLNRGFYSHVQTLDEVQEEVLKYVDVIATPLVLQDIEHPPTWTHAFADKSAGQIEDGQHPRVMIAVGVPAFNRQYQNSNVSRARILGVAGTDIPLADLDKLSLPYKLGVNGYAFILSNNGYVIAHPNLQVVYEGMLNENFNSVDITEVEQFNDDSGPREPGEDLLTLRRDMVLHRRGHIDAIPVKFHYDKMRRVAEVKQDYYYGPIDNTPFSMGFALPSEYGQTWIKVGEEVKKNLHMNINISSYFKGDNWKIHPDWVYCKYHYLEGHEYKTPEDELRHFLLKFSEKDWKWSEQYESEDESENSIESLELKCKRKTLNDDAYYCNKELVQLLIFDAKVTNSSYGNWAFIDEFERNLIQKYNATLRFVATMSGLTRWQFIYGETEIDSDVEFGDYHTTAIDETWYKSAILQHLIDAESFVYSVPHHDDPVENSELQITASYAIFPRDGGLEAPACVVGFQFSHSAMIQSFASITAKDLCNGCIPTCNSDDVSCYVIDSNAYVLLSDSNNDTGKFFGDIAGAVMEAMVEKELFKQIEVYDYQALCKVEENDGSFASILRSPFNLLIIWIHWILTEFILTISKIQMFTTAMPFYDDNDDYDETVVITSSVKKPVTHADGEEPEKIFPTPKPEPKYTPCDKKSTLYISNEEEVMKCNTEIHLNYSRPFHIKKIPKSNLFIVIIKVMYSTQVRKPPLRPEQISYDTPFPCYKLNMSFLERRRLEECFVENANESFYTYCGDAIVTRDSFKLIMLLFIFIFVYNKCYLI
ncbi:CACNA2D4.2 family protein [Megaselia abdita]